MTEELEDYFCICGYRRSIHSSDGTCPNYDPTYRSYPLDYKGRYKKNGIHLAWNHNWLRWNRKIDPVVKS